LSFPCFTIAKKLVLQKEVEEKYISMLNGRQ
jgi:hypothetical protein